MDADQLIVHDAKRIQRARRCAFQFPDGKRCNKTAIHGTNLCYQHGGLALVPHRVASIESRQKTLETIRYRLRDTEAAERMREMMNAGAPDDVREELALLRARVKRLVEDEGIDSDRAARAAERTIDAALRYGEYEIRAAKFITKAKVVAIIGQLLSLTEEAIYAETSSRSEADRILTRLHEAISSTFGSDAAGLDGEGPSV